VLNWSWDWLSQNSAAVQGIAAMLQVLAALLIFVITWRYVNLTNDLVKATENQGRLTESMLAASQQQIELQNKSIRVDLYDRYLKIYEALRMFLIEFSRPLALEMENIYKLDRLTVEAPFLLGPPAQQFIALVRKNSLEHWETLEQLTVWQLHKDRGQPVRDYQELLDKKHELEQWLVQDGFSLAIEYFRPYIGFAAADPDLPVSPLSADAPLRQQLVEDLLDGKVLPGDPNDPIDVEL
jgi:hypothetical protein